MVTREDIKEKIRGNQFFKDSFWAVFGNGIGYGLLLLAGIIIARLLGKDLYGEYGFVKTTMFQFAAFATLGLGYTSTKFIAQYRAENPAHLKSIVHASIDITTFISCLLALLLFIFAHPLAAFLEQPSLALAFRVLGVIIVLRALSTTLNGIIAGFGRFRQIAYINVASGLFMFVVCIPLTYYYSLNGSLLSLTLSQLLSTLLCGIVICKAERKLPPQEKHKYVIEITRFSIPVALQELTYALGRWLGILIITKYSSLGEVGLFTASELWGSVILIIPTLLSNVMLSHMSYNLNDNHKQISNVNMMLAVNLICTAVPFIFVFLLSPWIVSFYGPTFSTMTPVMRTIIFATIFTCCSNVLSSELIAQGKTWPLFIIRFTRDAATVVFGYVLIRFHNGLQAAQDYAISTLICAVLFFCLLYIYYRIIIYRQLKKEA